MIPSKLERIEFSESDIRELLRCIGVCLYDPEFAHGIHTNILYERLVKHLRQLLRRMKRESKPRRHPRKLIKLKKGPFRHD